MKVSIYEGEIPPPTPPEGEFSPSNTP